MLGFFFHLVVQALVQRLQALVLVTTGVDEILVAGGKLATQQGLEAIDDGGVAFHVGAPLQGWPA